MNTYSKRPLIGVDWPIDSQPHQACCLREDQGDNNGNGRDMPVLYSIMII